MDNLALLLFRQQNGQNAGRGILRTFVAKPVQGMDPRVRRTRQLLQQAFLELFQEKSFAAISVQDIAERATVNRATFYAHFEDKYDLLDSIIREQFQQVVASKLPSVPGWKASGLRLLIQAVFDFLGAFHSHCPPTDTQLAPLFERAVQQELYALLLTWLKQAPGAGARASRASENAETQFPQAPAAVGAGQRVSPETLASVMSWAIFGTAAHWSQETKAPSAEDMTNQVMFALTEGVAKLTPGFVAERSAPQNS
jgi:AcrR family transcriptional regulator